MSIKMPSAYLIWLNHLRPCHAAVRSSVAFAAHWPFIVFQLDRPLSLRRINEMPQGAFQVTELVSHSLACKIYCALGLLIHFSSGQTHDIDAKRSCGQSLPSRIDVPHHERKLVEYKMTEVIPARSTHVIYTWKVCFDSRLLRRRTHPRH